MIGTPLSEILTDPCIEKIKNSLFYWFISENEREILSIRQAKCPLFPELTTNFLNLFLVIVGSLLKLPLIQSLTSPFDAVITAKNVPIVPLVAEFFNQIVSLAYLLRLGSKSKQDATESNSLLTTLFISAEENSDAESGGLSFGLYGELPFLILQNWFIIGIILVIRENQTRNFQQPSTPIQLLSPAVGKRFPFLRSQLGPVFMDSFVRRHWGSTLWISIVPFIYQAALYWVSFDYLQNFLIKFVQPLILLPLSSLPILIKNFRRRHTVGFPWGLVLGGWISCMGRFATNYLELFVIPSYSSSSKGKVSEDMWLVMIGPVWALISSSILLFQCIVYDRNTKRISNSDQEFHIKPQ